jgi:predicted DCC family thiol-disulfide oxidoreductase YuxK
VFSLNPSGSTKAETSTRPALPYRPGVATLIFDGDCGFCTASARWAEQAFTGAQVALPWQSLGADVLASMGLSVADVKSAAWWVGSGGTAERGHRAVGRALQAGGGWRWFLGWACLNPPTSWPASAVYRAVVRWRHVLPGSTEACRRSV